MSAFCRFFIFLFVGCFFGNFCDAKEAKVCWGTNQRFSVHSNYQVYYNSLKQRYTNCTHVDGNLELTWLPSQSDLSFLQHIREVTGYVLISHVDLQRVVLPRLQIIHGRTLLKLNGQEKEFALVIISNKLVSLELSALRDILNGSVALFHNPKLCNIQTINWNEIMSDPEVDFMSTDDSSTIARECSPCHETCVAGCWAPGKVNCQMFSKTNCNHQCHQSRCFGPHPDECCHEACAGGCTGPKPSDCISCRQFNDNGVCTNACPLVQIYNPVTYSWEPNPYGKYAYGAICVDKCPKHLLKDGGACVKTCAPDKRAVNGECLPCNGPCPKTCKGDATINSANIDSFQGCTIIEGSIRIVDTSFTGYQQVFDNFTFGEHYDVMHPDRLEVFSTVREITGYLNIEAYHADFKNLACFRSLETIGGRTLYDFFSSLYIVHTSLESLNLQSLKIIKAGAVTIFENKHLCFAETINWEKIKQNPTHSEILQYHRNSENCSASGLVCDEQCTQDGCWGLGANQCLTCAHFSLDGTCVQNCSVIPGLYSSSGVCEHCHQQCSSCSGPGPEHCLPKCPATKYEEKGACKLCHSNCIDGCSGPRNTIGPGGCNSCEKVVMGDNATIDMCLHKNDSCPGGYYQAGIEGAQELDNLQQLTGKTACQKCHPRCKKCTGYGVHELVCQQCAKFKEGEKCVDQCRFDRYLDKENQECVPCDPECRGCTGPGPNNCRLCQHYTIYSEKNVTRNSSFICVSSPLSSRKEYPYGNAA